ncbi:MAG: hypothetical protein IJN03_00145 [Bacilli bacterium]|nr:hypothetical protein [Bacilli bacterium]
MINYPGNSQYINYGMPNKNAGDRQFLFPFLLGGLAGGAAVGLTRPRPIYNVAPYPQPYPPYYPGRPFYYNSYGGYIPYR